MCVCVCVCVPGQEFDTVCTLASSRRGMGSVERGEIYEQEVRQKLFYGIIFLCIVTFYVHFPLYILSFLDLLFVVVVVCFHFSFIYFLTECSFF